MNSKIASIALSRGAQTRVFSEFCEYGPAVLVFVCSAQLRDEMTRASVLALVESLQLKGITFVVATDAVIDNECLQLQSVINENLYRVDAENEVPWPGRGANDGNSLIVYVVDGRGDIIFFSKNACGETGTEVFQAIAADNAKRFNCCRSKGAVR